MWKIHHVIYSNEFERISGGGQICLIVGVGWGISKSCGFQFRIDMKELEAVN